MVLFCQLRLGSLHLEGSFFLLLFDLHNAQVLLLKHLLFSLSDSLHVRQCLVFSLLFAKLFNLKVPLLLHLFFEFELLDQFLLGLPILLDFALDALLTLFGFSYSLQALHFVFLRLLCLPLPELVFHLESLLHGEIARTLGRCR